MKTLLITLFLLVPSLYAKTVVISDLDETLRISQTHNYVLSLGAIITGVRPFPSMKYIFNDLKKVEDVTFYYISASYYRFYNGAKWIKKHRFPQGEVYQKQRLSDSNGDFKAALLERLWNEGKIEQDDHVLFFGDNSSHDESAYLDFKENHQLDGEIYIRDIKVKATYLTDLFEQEQMDGIHYYLTENDLLEGPLSNYFSPSTERFIARNFKARRGVVKTQQVYLKRKLREKLCYKPLAFLSVTCQVAVSREITAIARNYFR